MEGQDLSPVAYSHLYSRNPQDRHWVHHRLHDHSGRYIEADCYLCVSIWQPASRGALLSAGRLSHSRFWG